MPVVPAWDAEVESLCVETSLTHGDTLSKKVMGVGIAEAWRPPIWSVLAAGAGRV